MLGENVKLDKLHIQRGTQLPSYVQRWTHSACMNPGPGLYKSSPSQRALPAEEADAEDDVREGEVLAEGEEEIETKIHQIHQATGHGSMKNLIEALEKRGVSNKVLQVAKQWKCPMCETYKRQDPRRFSTLETIPRRWQRVQMDMGSWCHPGTRGKSMS